MMDGFPLACVHPPGFCNPSLARPPLALFTTRGSTSNSR